VLASFGRPILLADVVTQLTDSSGPKWIECCLSGTYLGHSSGKPLPWGPELFQVLIDNLHRNPSFKTGPDGVGCVPVVPWDHEHESEIAKQNLVERGIPLPPDGLPSWAWTLDLQSRLGADGKPSLWALTEFIPETVQQIREKKYRWCSLAVSPIYIDPVTGDDQGPTVTSIALTNDPFIQGLVPLAATRKGAPVTQTLDQWGPAESAIEVLVGLKRVFQLDADDEPQAILDQITLLRAMLTSGMVPNWVPVDQVIGDIRRLLEVPLLTPPDEILGGAEQAVKDAISGGGNVEEPSTAPQVALEQKRMATAAILATLCSILALPADADDAKLLQATQAAKDSADKTKTADDLVTQLKAIFDAPGTSELLAKAAKACADSKQIEPMMAALEGARAALTEGAQQNAANEAGAIAATLAHGDTVLASKLAPTIRLSRFHCFDAKTMKDDPEKLKAFREMYPLTDDVQKALLTTRMIAGPSGTQLGGSVTGYETQVITQSASAGNNGASPEVQKVVDAINAQSGPNAYAKANNLLCSRSAAHKSLPLHEQHRVAGEFTRSVLDGKVPTGFTL
jgi:hypothetical protein